MENSYVGTPPVRKAFGMRMVKPFFHVHFRNIVKTIFSNFENFKLIVGLLKMYKFLPLNFLFILMHVD